jgi:hypothetical protein
MKLGIKTKLSRKAKITFLGVALIVVVVASLVMAQELTGKVLPNTGTLNPSGQAAGSPLLVVRGDSVQNASQHGNDTSLLIEITEIQWGQLYGGLPAGVVTDTLKILKTGISLYNNGSTTMYPAWTTSGLPTGCTLKCFVSGFDVEWTQGDYNAFHLPAKDLSWASYYQMYFVLSVTNKAIPQPLAFSINFDYSEQPTT